MEAFISLDCQNHLVHADSFRLDYLRRLATVGVTTVKFECVDCKLQMMLTTVATRKGPKQWIHGSDLDGFSTHCAVIKSHTKK